MAASDQKTLQYSETVANLSTEALIGHLAQLDANVQCTTISPALRAALLSAKASRAREIADFRIEKLREPKWGLNLVGDELRLVQNVHFSA